MPSNMVEVHQRLHIYANESKHKNSVYVSWLMETRRRGEERGERRERGVSPSLLRERREVDRKEGWGEKNRE